MLFNAKAYGSKLNGISVYVSFPTVIFELIPQPDFVSPDVDTEKSEGRQSLCPVFMVLKG